MEKEAYYFSHDANARNDTAILAMRSVYGAEGYGWFWMIVEILREQADYKHRMTGKYWCNALAMQMQCECNAVAEFVHDCINEFGLFVTDGEHFWSESLIRRMAKKEERSKKARESAQKRWDNTNVSCERNANALPTQSERNANAMQGKESKVKEIKVKQTKRFIPPTLEEVTEYCAERKNKINPQKFIDFYAASNWTRGNNTKIKDWKACVRTWEQRETAGRKKNQFDLPEDYSKNGKYTNDDLEKILLKG